PWQDFQPSVTINGVGGVAPFCPPVNRPRLTGESMSTLGKVLAALNILGLLVFLVMLFVVFTKQRSWEYANFRHALLLACLATTKEDSDKQGNPASLRAGEGTLKELFGSQIATVEDEVKNVQNKVNGKVSAAGTTEQKINLMARALLPLSKSNLERERYVA